LLNLAVGFLCILYFLVDAKQLAPIFIEVNARTIDESYKTKIYRRSPRNIIYEVMHHDILISEKWFQSIILAIPRNNASRVESVAVEIGSRKYRYTAAELHRDWTPVPFDQIGGLIDREEFTGVDEGYLFLESPPGLSLEKTRLPSATMQKIINWPGDSIILRKGVITAILFCIPQFIIFFFLLKGTARRFGRDHFERTILPSLTGNGADILRRHYRLDGDEYRCDPATGIMDRIRIMNVLASMSGCGKEPAGDIRRLIKVHPAAGGSMILAIPFMMITIVFNATGYGPVHDAINWQGVFHYFYSSVAGGTIPYWNPYSQGGTPFYVYFQPFGLLEPSNFFFIALQGVFGLSSLTGYICHYLFIFYLFILGAFLTMRQITKNFSKSLLFAFVLMLAVLPMVMRQNGTINSFFLAPLITFLLIRFLDESDGMRKGMSLATASILLGISANVYIPSGMIFYVILLSVGLSVSRRVEFIAGIRYLFSTRGAGWLAFSAITVLLTVAPTVALLFDFNASSELFPYVRALQKNGNQLLRFYASDLNQQMFSTDLVKNLTVSMTPANLLGLITEPFEQHFRSENILYIGILPFLIFIRSVVKPGNRQIIFFSFIALIILMTMTTLSNYYIAPQSMAQKVISTVFPFLRMLEVYQNFGILFIFLIIMIVAIGYDPGRPLPAYLYLIFFGMFGYKYVLYSLYADISPVITLTSYAFFAAVTALYGRYGRRDFNIRTVAIALTLLDLLFFNAFCFAGKTGFNYIDAKYRFFTQSISPLPNDMERGFINHRLPTSYPESPLWTEPALNNFVNSRTFFGHEIFANRKTAHTTTLTWNLSGHMGNTPPLRIEADIMENFIFRHASHDELRYIKRFYRNDPGTHSYQLLADKMKNFPQMGIALIMTLGTCGYGYTYLPWWDCFYTLESYYDLISQVRIDRQPELFSMNTPIVRFVPERDAVIAADKYDSVARINTIDPAVLADRLFIVLGNATATPSHVTSSENVNEPLRFRQTDIDTYKKKLAGGPPAPSLSCIITGFTINSLDITTSAPVNGYLYYGDGFSRHWKATVDGNSVPVLKSNINFKSVSVPSGRHRVRFEYDPVAFRYSLYLYVFGLVLYLMIAFMTLTMASRRPVSAEHNKIAEKQV